MQLFHRNRPRRGSESQCCFSKCIQYVRSDHDRRIEHSGIRALAIIGWIRKFLHSLEGFPTQTALASGAPPQTPMGELKALPHTVIPPGWAPPPAPSRDGSAYGSAPPPPPPPPPNCPCWIRYWHLPVCPTIHIVLATPLHWIEGLHVEL